MDKEKLAGYLETIPKPVPVLPEEQRALKIALFSARKSSRIGFLLVGLPGLVILLFIVLQIFHIAPGSVRWLGNVFASIHNPVRAIVVFVFVVGFPLVAVFLNLLSLCYFQYDRGRREFHMTFKIRWWNIMITLAGGGLASFYILHLLADTILGGR